MALNLPLIFFYFNDIHQPNNINFGLWLLLFDIYISSIWFFIYTADYIILDSQATKMFHQAAIPWLQSNQILIVMQSNFDCLAIKPWLSCNLAESFLQSTYVHSAIKLWSPPATKEKVSCNQSLIATFDCRNFFDCNVSNTIEPQSCDPFLIAAIKLQPNPAINTSSPCNQGLIAENGHKSSVRQNREQAAIKPWLSCNLPQSKSFDCNVSNRI